MSRWASARGALRQMGSRCHPAQRVDGAGDANQRVAELDRRVDRLTVAIPIPERGDAAAPTVV